ncbi:MAG: hypothetical protein JZU55_10770, partial [Afipia sp.]|nr:hypothetical protein [Afipia sp.]
MTSSVLAEIFIDKARVIQESEPPSRTDGDCAPRVIAAPSVTRKHAMLRRPRMLSILGHIAISAGILLL